MRGEPEKLLAQIDKEAELFVLALQRPSTQARLAAFRGKRIVAAIKRDSVFGLRMIQRKSLSLVARRSNDLSWV